MGRNDDMKALTDSIKCLIVFENKSALLYGEVSSKIGKLPLIKSLFIQLSLDSQKHSEFLKGIAQSLPKVSWKPNDMPKVIAEAMRSIDDFQVELSDIDKIPEDELVNLSKQFVSLENIMGQMYDTLIRFDTMEFISTELGRLYNLDIELLKTMLMEIVNDEEYHKETLANVQKLLADEKEEKTSNTPAVRFQNPDGWNRPILTI